MTADPTPLAEQIAREHRLTTRAKCACPDVIDAGGDTHAWVAHIATVTEQAVRERVAAEIRRVRYEHALVAGESPMQPGTWHAGNDHGIQYGLGLAMSITTGAPDA